MRRQEGWGVAWLVVWLTVAAGDHTTNLTPTSALSDTTTTTTITTTTTSPPPPVPCESAKISCALREGCGMALQNYMLGCADLIAGRIETCDDYCRNSLIALTSTAEGHNLMDCVCSDDYCRESKARVEVCRDAVVTANLNTTVVTCSVAHWICSADTLCATAITYYDRYCRKMFLGKGCSLRCNNSLAILQRQAKAAKLATCECDGSEPFDCEGIKRNTERFCFPRQEDPGQAEAEAEAELERGEESTNQVEASRASLSGGATVVVDGGAGGRTASLLTLLLLLPAR